MAERAEFGEGKREMLLAVTIPERPGSFREFCHAISNRPITEFNYRLWMPAMRKYLRVWKFSVAKWT